MRPWGVTLTLYWCPNCNVPLRQRICSRCGGEGFKVNISEPGDARPAFASDLSLIREAMLYEFGSDALYRELIVDGAVYLNKTPHYDDMKEVISGGTIVGRLYFDPSTYAWRWRLNKVSAPIALDLGLIRAFKVGKAKPLMDLGPGDREGNQAVVIDNSGEPVALAVVRRGRYRVQTVFKEQVGEIIRKPSSFNLFEKCNDLWVRSRLSKAIKNLVMMAEKTGLPPVVSYSGGKDSITALSLTMEAGLEPVILFNDTGLELPPTLKNVDDVAHKFGLRLLTASAGNKFWDSVNIFGPPAKDYRWCCKVVKMAPIARIYKKYFPNGLLAIIGQRAFESVDRSRSGAVWRNRWLPAALNISPLQEWDQLTVWFYILQRRLPVNELYFKGFDRLGCFMCPAGNIAEYYMVERNYPECWRRWEHVLIEWKERLNESDLWIRYHLWRWLNPLSQGRRRLESWLGIKKPSDWRLLYERVSGLSLAPISLSEDHYRIRIINGQLSLDSICEQWSIIADTPPEKVCSNNPNDDCALTLRKSGNTIIVRPNEVEVQGPDARETAFDVLKIMVRWSKCCSCGSCEIWCPTNAIKVKEGRPIVDPRRCIGCKACIEACPIAEVFTERLLIPQLLNNPKGRPRRKHSFILELQRSARRARSRKARKAELTLENFPDFLDLGS